MATVAAGVYARISKDQEDTRLGVTRQVQDCTAEAARRGWAVADTYIDNDVSATRSRRRPEYERMLADVRAGRLAGLVVWDVDRLTRTPRELEDVIDLADQHGLSLASVGGEIDLGTPQGRMTARIKGSVARHDTDQASRRIRRKFQENAEAGKPHGAVAYGYRREDGKDLLDPVQADVVREAARRLLAGESMRAVAADYNRRGVPVPRRGVWSSTTLRQLMVRDRNAGLRRHRGQVLGDAAWEPIYDRGTHDRVVALIRDPARRTSTGSTRKHLLTGIARCGRGACPGTVVVNPGRKVGTEGKRQPPAYVCATCFRVRRKQSDVDAVVEAVVVGRLSQPDVLAELARRDPAELRRAQDEAQALEARLANAADDYADGTITGDQLRRITARLQPKIAAAQALVAASQPEDVLSGVVGPDATERWREASLDARRAIVDTLVTVTILPSGSGRSFDPNLIRIEWR